MHQPHVRIPGARSLTLGRREGESILIGDHIRIIFSRWDRDRGIARITIEAPGGVNIVREEIVGREKK